MRLSVNMRFSFRIFLIASSLSIFSACGGSSVGRSVPNQDSDIVGDTGKELKGAPERFDATAADADLEGQYAGSSAIDFKYTAIPATRNVDGSSGERVSVFDDLIDVLGVIHYPLVSADTSAPAAGFPIILFQHGRHSTCSTTGDASGTESSGTDCEANGLVPIRSDKGYDYIAETMASNGYVVISIDVNDINAQDSGSNDQGITARAEIILHHLDIFRDIAYNPASTFAIDARDNDFSPLYGFMDFSSIGLMGHSRGGNGVAKAITYNQDARFRSSTNFDLPHEIKAVFSLAPTDFDSELPLNTAWVTLSPYCDGDVSTLHGVYMYDNIRYDANDVSQPQFMVTSMGANHNYYNDFWFNDDATLNGFDPYCTAASPVTGRYSRVDQKRHGEFLIASFLRLFVGAESQFAGYWSGYERAPSSACPEGVETCDERLHMSFHQSKENLIVVDTTLTDESLTENEFGLANSLDGFTFTGWCAPNGGSLDDLLGFNTDRCPSIATISKAPQIYGGYVGNLASINYTLPVEGLDVSDKDFLTLRMGVSVTPENALGQDFTLTLTDINEVSVSLLASDFTDALYFPPGLTVAARDTGAKTVINMVPFRLDAQALFDSELDLSKLTNVNVAFDQRLAGTIQITDVLFQKVPY
ncbi:MAG: hypothetical protein ACI9SK_001427 [Zhongshania sp.]|jgi:hypothetical protein